MTLLKYVFTFAVLTVALRNVRASISKESELALFGSMHDSFVECAEEFSLDVDDLKEQQKSTGTLDGIDKCFFGCVLKKKGVINEEGKYDVDKGVEEMKKLITNDDDLKILETMVTVCSAVNDEEVSDGNKGCERAFLFVSCIKKHSDGK